MFKNVQKLVKIVQKLFKNCSKFFQKLFKHCPKIGQNCPTMVQKLFKNCPKIVQKMSKIVQKLSKIVTILLCASVHIQYGPKWYNFGPIIFLPSVFSVTCLIFNRSVSIPVWIRNWSLRKKGASWPPVKCYTFTKNVTKKWLQNAFGWKMAWVKRNL